MDPDRRAEDAAARAHLTLLRYLATSLDELIAADSNGAPIALDPPPSRELADGEEEDGLASLLLGSYSRELSELPVGRLLEMRQKVSEAALPLLNAILIESTR